MDYRFRQDLQLYVSLQQVNIWGQAPQVQVIDRTGGLSIFEAYAALPLGGGFDLKLGRQQIVLDEDRIFGSLDWHPVGRAHERGEYQLETCREPLPTLFLRFQSKLLRWQGCY